MDHRDTSAATDFRKTSPEAVEDVVSGRKAVASAAWWGFDEQDSTDALQSAILSGAKRVVVPNLGRDWIVRPIRIRRGLELVFERGVRVTAKRGEFRGRGDCLFRARDVDDLVIRGYGATLQMQKEDYIVGKVLQDLGWDRWFGQYEKAEWRSVLSLEGCSNARIYGVTLRDSGGDGIYIAGGESRSFCKDIYIRDVVCDNNYRQGISVISVQGLLVENSVFKNTWGTPPSSGVDIEPDKETERVSNVVFRNCVFQDNYGDGIEIFLSNLSEASNEVSLRFEDCYVTSRRGSGIRVSKVRPGLRGSVEFRNCVVEDTEGYGVKIQDKSPLGLGVIFADCTVRNAAQNRQYRGRWSPIWIHLMNRELAPSIGGVSFENCVVEDEEDRPAVVIDGEQPFEASDIAGKIAVRNPHGARMELENASADVTLELEEKEW